MVDRLRGNAIGIVGLAGLSLAIAGFVDGSGWFLLTGSSRCLLTPIVAPLAGDRATIAEWWGEETAERATDHAETAPLEPLQRRYAEALSGTEFERKANPFLEVDSLAEREADEAVATDDAVDGATANLEPERVGRE